LGPRSLLSNGHRAPIAEVKPQGREADQSYLSSAEAKNDGAIPSLPLCLYDIVLNYIKKYRQNAASFTILWHVNPLLDNGHEISSHTIAVAK
jgi:hypothetical protein